MEGAAAAAARRRDHDQAVADLRKRHEDEVAAVLRAEPQCLRTRPRVIATAQVQAAHREWQEREVGRLRVEMETALEQLTAEFHAPQRTGPRVVPEEYGPEDGPAAVGGDGKADVAALRAEAQTLRDRVTELERRRLSPGGQWVYCAAPIDHPAPIVRRLNTLQPAPDSIRGCVTLPIVHLWIRPEERPTGLRYSLQRHPDVAAVLERGDAVVLGLTLGGDLVYLRIDHPPPAPPPTAPLPAPAPWPPSLRRWEGLTGDDLTPGRLRVEFARLGESPDGTVAARSFVDAFGLQFLAAPGDGDDDRGVAAVFARHGLDPGGRLSFDAFCVLALTLAKR